MSNLDEVRQNIVGKFCRAIGDTDVGEAALPFIKLALVDQQAAFEAILWQRQAAQVEKPMNRRIHEQIRELNDWLAANAVDLYHEPDTDTAEAMVKAVNRLTAQLAQVRTELAAAIDERNFADTRCAELEQQLAQLAAERDELRADLADLRDATVEFSRDIGEIIAERDALRQQAASSCA